MKLVFKFTSNQYIHIPYKVRTRQIFDLMETNTMSYKDLDVDEHQNGEGGPQGPSLQYDSKSCDPQSEVWTKTYIFI